MNSTLMCPPEHITYFIVPDVEFSVQLIENRNIELSKHFSCLPDDLQYILG